MSFSTKENARMYLQEVRRFINLSECCRHLEIDRKSITYFLKSEVYDFMVSLENLNKLIDFINEL